MANEYPTAGHKIHIFGNKCYRCGHEWRPLDVEERPIVCPKCKNPYWWKPRKKKKNGKSSGS